MAVPDERPVGRPRHVRAAGDAGSEVAAGFDRQPPQDLMAEQSVLGGMLLSKDAIADVVEVLQARTTSTAPRTRRCTTASSTCTAGASRPTR